MVKAEVMQKFAMGIFLATGVTACSVSQDSVLGEPPTTTKEVVQQINGAEGEEVLKWRMENATPDAEGLRRYHGEQGVRAWVPRTKYVENKRLVMYIYPKKDALGNVMPGYAIEMPLYEKVHALLPGEF